MAYIRNLKLEISKVDNAKQRRVTVTYEVCFTDCETSAGSTFNEKVTLRGDDPVWDDHLITLHGSCIRAQKGCIDRRFSRIVSTSVLDEDADTIIFGWVISGRDEVYARVRLTPFEPSGDSERSNTVKAHFGPAG